MGTAERPPSSRLQTHRKKPLTYLFQARKRAINTNGIINKIISLRAHMASFVPVPSSAAAVSRPSACSLELPNFRGVLCSSAALSLSISLCKAKRENHWQQRLCCRDVCGCQARGQNLHVNCDKGVGANTEWTDKMLKLVGVKGALGSSVQGISHDWIARDRR